MDYISIKLFEVYVYMYTHTHTPFFLLREQREKEAQKLSSERRRLKHNQGVCMKMSPALHPG